MSSENAALACRAVILMGYFMVAALAFVDGLDSITRFRRKHYGRDLAIDLLGNIGQALFVGGAMYGTYTRLDKDFTLGLPAMAVGIMLYVAWLLIKKNDGEPLNPSGTEMLNPLFEEKPPCGIKP